MAEHLLPTLERINAFLSARGGALPPPSPTRVFGIAPIVVQVDGLRREEWSDPVELSPRLYDAYPKGHVPPPDLTRGLVETTFKVLDDDTPARRGRCMNCVLRPGLGPCPTCIGTGAGAPVDDFVSTLLGGCTACRGTGFSVCTMCEGTTQVVACAVRYVTDKPVRLRRVFVPQVGLVRGFIESQLDADSRWPDTLAFDPQPGFVSSAYRGASAARAEDGFHGFFFGDALTACLGARNEMTTGLSRFDVRTYAVPTLWLVWEQPTGEQHRAYFFDATGELREVSTTPPPTL